MVFIDFRRITAVLSSTQRRPHTHTDTQTDRPVAHTVHIKRKEERRNVRPTAHRLVFRRFGRTTFVSPQTVVPLTRRHRRRSSEFSPPHTHTHTNKYGASANTVVASLSLPTVILGRHCPSIHPWWSVVTCITRGRWVSGGLVGGNGDPYGVARATGTSATSERVVQHHGGDANAGAQRNERGRQRNVGLSSVPALCRPFKLSVPPCLETPCKYVKIASAAVVAVCVVQTFFPFHFIFISNFFSLLPPQKKMPFIYFSFYFFPTSMRFTFLPLPVTSTLCPYIHSVFAHSYTILYYYLLLLPSRRVYASLGVGYFTPCDRGTVIVIIIILRVTTFITHNNILII